MAEYKIFTDEEKAHAVDVVKQQGLARAVATLNEEGIVVAKTTLREWCKAAGVETSSEERRAQTQAATAAAALARKQRLDASDDRLVDALSAVGLRSVAQLLKRLALDEKAMDAGDEPKIAFRDLVGAVTRAVHDMQLLKGEATERSETVGTREQVLAIRDRLVETENERKLELLQGGADGA